MSLSSRRTAPRKSAPPKLAIVSSHPIQYYAPVFRALAAQGAIDPRVFYTWSQAAEAGNFDPGFATEVRWDVPLLAGYAHQFVQNVSKKPGTHHFGGLENPTLIREIENWQPEAVLVYGWNSRSHLNVLRHFKGRIPVLFRGDSTLLDRQPWWRAALRRAFLRWVYGHVDLAIAVGSNSRDYFEWCGLSATRIEIAPHSVDTLRFASDVAVHERRALQWRREFGIPAEAVVFLFAGKLQAKKNPGLLLEAFAHAGAAAHLVLAGQGEVEAELKFRSRNRGNVHFLPFQNQSVMPSVYRLGDVFVLPSQGPGETWGLALNEAMACGRAVIASSKVGAARDLIQPGVTGWVFESGDGDALAGLLREAAAHGREHLRTMGAAARLDSNRWSTEESARRIGEIVRSCVVAQ